MYWCVLRFLDRNSDIFDEKAMRTGEFVLSFADLVGWRDKEIDGLLSRLNINYFHFAFRWFVCLLLREIPSQWMMEIWDTYIAQRNIQEFFPHYCYSYLQSLRNDLLQSAEFESCLLLLHHPAPSIWSSAYLSALFSTASQSHSAYQHTALQMALCIFFLALVIALLSLFAAILGILLAFLWKLQENKLLTQ